MVAETVNAAYFLLREGFLCRRVSGDCHYFALKGRRAEPRVDRAFCGQPWGEIVVLLSTL